MPYTPVAIENFTGLNLADDPGTVGWSGAIDLLNVDFDQRGRVRSRDGYAKFTSAAAVLRYQTLAAFYKSDGTKQLIAQRGAAADTGSGFDALNTSGGVVATQTGANTGFMSVARFAAPGSEHAYVAGSGTGSGAIYRWTGAAWQDPAVTAPVWSGTTPTGRHVAVTPWDNRLVNARRTGTSAGDNPSTVRFSDAGTPTTWGTNNYVDIWPGDGEEITALVAWRDLLFAFKESRIAAFYGTSTDSSGNPIFNWRPLVGAGLVSAGGASAYRATAVAPEGVYFLNRRGIWLTSGGPPTMVSSALDPIFRGQGASSFFQGSALNQAQITLAALHWYDRRLYFAYPSGSSTYNDKLLVFNPDASAWTLWDIPCADLETFRVSNAEELTFAYATGTNDIGRHSSSYTQDGGDGTSTGVAIASRYRSGFSDLGHPELRRKRIRQFHVRGTGTVNVAVATDDGSLGSSTSTVLTGPFPNYRIAQRGRNFSWQLSASAAWRLDSLIGDVG